VRAASPPGCSPRESPDRTGNTGRRRACSGPTAASCLHIPPDSRPRAATRPWPAPTIAPRAALWTLAAILCGATPLSPPSLASPAAPLIHPSREERPPSGSPFLVRPAGTGQPGPIARCQLNRSNAGSVLCDRPCGAIVGLFTWLRDRPISRYQPNDSAHFEEKSLAGSAKSSVRAG
jgi:hypothetical protein